MKNKTKKNGPSDTFGVNEITNLASIATKLQTGEESVYQCILRKLTPGTQQILAGYAANGDGAQALATALALEFAGIISGPSIYESANFDGILTEKARKSVVKDMQGEGLSRSNRLLLECVFPEGIARRFNGKQQVRIRVGTGMFRIQGEAGIHGKIKIKGKTYSQKLTSDNDAKKAKMEYEKWVVEKRSSVNLVETKKGTLKSYVEPYLESRREMPARDRNRSRRPVA